MDDDQYEIDNNLIENSVEPQAWLTKVLERIPDHSIQRLEELLPQNLR
jgi:hypothetical protein